MKKIIFILMAAVLGMTACNDSESVTPKNSDGELSEIAYIQAGGEACNCEVEMACVTGGEAGTKCVNGAGKSRLFNACKAVKAGIVGVPTFEEIEIYSDEHAQWMVANGFYFPQDYEISRQIAKESLLSFYYP